MLRINKHLWLREPGPPLSGAAAAWNRPSQHAIIGYCQETKAQSPEGNPLHQIHIRIIQKSPDSQHRCPFAKGPGPRRVCASVWSMKSSLPHKASQAPRSPGEA